MYETGYAWGLEDMRNFVKRSQGEFEVGLFQDGHGHDARDLVVAADDRRLGHMAF